jgi:hypothetical protein
MTILTINVTERHIKEGTRGDCGYCPVALAVGEVIDSPQTEISVGHERVIIFDTHQRAILPPEARQFISLFDKRYYVKPFSFEVDLVPLAEWLKS